jgi:hypothetical protein
VPRIPRDDNIGRVVYWEAWPSSKVKLTVVLVAAYAGGAGGPNVITKTDATPKSSAAVERTITKPRSRIPDIAPPHWFAVHAQP